MLKQILSNLVWKTALATLAAVLLVQAAIVWPNALQKKKSAEAQIENSLLQMASEDADVKAQALMQKRYERVKSRFTLWKTGRFPVTMALLDAQGKTVAASGEAPDFTKDDANDLLNDALSGKPVQDELDGLGVAIVALGTKGDLGEGEQPIGAFAVLADRDKAIGAVGRNGAFGNSVLLVLSALFATGLILGINYLLFIKPIRLIEKQDRQLNLETGRFVAIPDEQLASDELGSLGRTRNRLLERLRETQSLIRETNTMLERAESKYRALVQSIPDIVFRMNLAGEFLFLSPSFERLMNIKPESIYDSPDLFFERVHPDDRTALREALAAMAKGEKHRSATFRLLAPRSGDPPLQFSVSYAPVIDQQNRMQGIEGVFRRLQGPEIARPMADVAAGLAPLIEVGRALHSGPLQGEVFDYLAEKGAEMAGAERSVVALLDEEQCQAIGIYNLPEDARRSPLPLADTAEAKVVETREPVALLDEEAWNAYGLGGPYIGVPVLDAMGQPLGMICCHGLSADAGEDTIASLLVMADLISPVLESEKALRAAARAQAIEEARPRPSRRKKDEPLSFFEQDAPEE